MTNASQIASMVHGVRPLNIAVVGATGNVGTTILEVLEERGIPIASLRAMASTRSEGSVITCGEHEAKVENLDNADPSGIDVALFSAGAQRARDHAERFAKSGAIVIDNSSAFRMEDDIPLVVPEVNHDALKNIPRGIVANPNCSTIQLVVALRPINDIWGIVRVSVTTMQSTSGTGHAAMQELEHQSRVIMGVATDNPSVYPHEIAFNVLPQCDDFEADSFTKEEHKLVNETRKIFAAPALRIIATCTRVPVFIGHSEAVHLELSSSATPDQVRAALSKAPGVLVVDNPENSEYPMPRDAAGQDDVLVGRIRQDPSVTENKGIALFIAADNLRKGAATNAVQIVEKLAELGTWN